MPVKLDELQYFKGTFDFRIIHGKNPADDDLLTTSF